MTRPKVAEGLRITFLGQAGFLFEGPERSWIVDPYLSDAVGEAFGDHLRIPASQRERRLALLPSKLDYYFITHEHLDHLDPQTIALVAQRSGPFTILTSAHCASRLRKAGFPRKVSLRVIDESWTELEQDFACRLVPAAHPKLERFSDASLRFAGVMWRYGAQRLYHSGDTSPHAEIFASLAGERIDCAFLPINERNFFRDEMDIVGNMSCREALYFARRIGAVQWVPFHWDLFAANRTSRAELDAALKTEQIESPYRWQEPESSWTLGSGT
ncbi:MAG TPA: MBL fold metallo-hydrolase [Bdellovibrionota bacterium]|jgi:L-ascorbate metabolism protein UlaG (beta-lactamase superfamily)|nr:MBL fold metallo-hydrolase [Bdellovibrionota bacterium]